MPTGKKWHAEEIRLAAVAWIQTMNDAAVTDQKLPVPVFQVAVIENLKKIEPPGHESGRYHERGGKHVMDFLRDYVFKEVLKFNDALRIVHRATKPNDEDVMEQQKINMAVAIHRGLTKTMDYHFKNVDPLSWRFYTAWIELRNIPRFKFDPMNTEPALRKTKHSSTSAAPLWSETANDNTTATITAVDTGTLTTTANSTLPVGTKNATVARTGPLASAVAPGTTGHLQRGTTAGSALGFQNTAANSANMANNNNINNNNNLLAQFASFRGQVGAFMQNQEIQRRGQASTAASMDADQQQSMVSFYKRKLDEQIAESANLFQMAATYKRQLDEKDAMYKRQLDAKDAMIQSLKEQVSGLKKKRKRTVETDEENTGAAAATSAAASAGESTAAAASGDED